MIVGSNILAGASGQQGYFLNRSVRLRSSASAYFNRTPVTTTNRRTFTWSGWVKRGAIGGEQTMFGSSDSGASNSSVFVFRFLSANTIRLVQADSAGNVVLQFDTSAVFRDPSAWYHIVLYVDTNQATNTNGIRVYVNNINQTGTYTVYTQNTNCFVNTSTVANYMGRYSSTTPTAYFDGYLTEVNFIDGLSLTPTSFGLYDPITGVWQPKKYAGSYGINGFYLNFNDNSAATATAIGADSSGNGNNWTPNAIILSPTTSASYDSMTDVPTLTSPTTANFPVLNAVSAYSGLPISAANLQTTAVASGANWFSRSTTMAVSSGKWYAEFSMPSITSGAQGNPVGFGVMPSSIDFSAIGQQIGGSGYGYGFYCPDTTGSTPKKIVAGTVTAVGTGSATATTDIFMVAFDLTSGNAWFGKNGTWYAGNPSAGTGASITGITAGEYIFGLSVYRDGTYTNNTAAINFGQRPFSYTPPTGFLPLNTDNLPTPTIPNGAAQFAATTYTGNGTSQSITNTVNGTSMQPDLLWTKSRSSTAFHYLQDSVRGVNKALFSNATDAEYSITPTTTTLNNNGFSFNGGESGLNANTQTYIAWQWKANGTPAVTNTSGSISSTISANTTSGFSIVTYTGTGANATVGHGLNLVPSMIFIKNRNSGAIGGAVYHASLGATKYLQLFQTTTGNAMETTDNTAWNGGSPTFNNNVFSLGSLNRTNSAQQMVAYCFSEIAGYSKFGSYIGNGAANGPFVYLGFRPRFLMIKASSAAGSWGMVDTSRDTFNLSTKGLYADLSDAEDITRAIDILSNGFKLRSATANNLVATYIYAAFAENPFNYSLAR
jgi:hypothetical protein